mmetsp:Transcript_17632/g.49930  ORF Transcript_17632/g.49930 Transcript_17632/m.49930 type:complete len:227 (+) Transcript_17632:394-1074(+)
MWPMGCAHRCLLIWMEGTTSTWIGNSSADMNGSLTVSESPSPAFSWIPPMEVPSKMLDRLLMILLSAALRARLTCGRNPLRVGKGVWLCILLCLMALSWSLSPSLAFFLSLFFWKMVEMAAPKRSPSCPFLANSSSGVSAVRWRLAAAVGAATVARSSLAATASSRFCFLFLSSCWRLSSACSCATSLARNKRQSLPMLSSSSRSMRARSVFLDIHSAVDDDDEIL